MKILLVDDDAQMAEAITMFLEREGHTIETCSRAWTALRCYHLSHFDAIITDYRMPGMDGLEFAKEARTITNIPIILNTGSINPPECESVTAVVVKGHFDKLAKVLRELSKAGGQDDIKGRDLDMHCGG